jgi:hypothetical protein
MMAKSHVDIIDDSPRAALARAEALVGHMEGAKRTLVYLMRQAMRGDYDDNITEQMAAVEFFAQHGISLDYVLLGWPRAK